jgi:hypothetical protein
VARESRGEEGCVKASRQGQLVGVQVNTLMRTGLLVKPRLHQLRVADELVILWHSSCRR